MVGDGINDAALAQADVGLLLVQAQMLQWNRPTLC